MPTTKPIPSLLCSPLRALRALFAKLRAAYGSRLEYDVATAEIDREQSELVAADGSAAQIELHLDRARQLFDRALHDAKTPGVITTAEARPILRELLRDTALAHHHEEHLRHLAN